MLQHILPNHFNKKNRLTVAHLIQETHQYVANVELINIFLVRAKGNLFTCFIEMLKTPEEYGVEVQL
jgi:hypothetical protein